MLSLGRGRAPDGIVCIGHSLGGAVAQLAALWLAQRFPRADLRVVTFGSPRVGNRAFKVLAACVPCRAFRSTLRVYKQGS